ncbi:MAG: M48 family metallopeptidase [Geminicoccaceae bacterium]|nr:M48 family metallopeptidase [Geminicoccaceae bacterium]
MRRTLRNMAAATVMLGLAGCATAPETGRSQLIIFPESQDAQMGLEAYQQIKSEMKEANDPALERRIETVGGRIAAISPHPDWQWEFTLFQDDTPNAFALPGGKVGVNTGLFKVAKTDDQLAAVMGHEVAHAIARHGAERMSSGMLTQLGLVGLGIATQDQTTVGLAAAAATLGVTLPHSREQESEADHIGLLYMARAGYDPRGAIQLWKNMEAAGGDQPLEFLSTHPSHGNRIARLEEWMPEALAEYRGT